MPIGRRTELLRWASSAEDRYLVEDDYDSEFRYRGKPIPSLQSADTAGRVIYIGTFSKSVAPCNPHQLHGASGETDGGL